MSSRASVTKTYTRSAILAWANAIFESAHLTFQDIPCHDVGLLLYGIFHSTSSACGAAMQNHTSTTNNEGLNAPTVPLLSTAELNAHDALHNTTCVRFLQQLQFPASTTVRSKASAALHLLTMSHASASSLAAVAGASEDRGGNTTVTQMRNAEHVLAMIRALSTEEATLLRVSSVAQERSEQTVAENAMATVSTTAAGNTANVVLLLGPSMTPEAWLSGSAFVEELKLWRWVRLMADRHLCTVESIRTTILAYLQQVDGEEMEKEQTTMHTVLSTVSSSEVDKRQRCDLQIVVPEEKSQAKMEDLFSTTNSDHAERRNIFDASAQNQELKRMRLEKSPSPVPLSSASMTPLNGSVSPVHVLLSPTRDTEKPMNGTEETQSYSLPLFSSVAAGAAKAALAVQDATAATSTPYVAQAVHLQSALRRAKQTLEQTFRDAAGQAVVDAEASSTHSSTGAAAETCREELSVSVVRQNMLPAVSNSSERLETICRQRLVRHVFPCYAAEKNPTGAGGEEGGATGNYPSISTTSALIAPPSCAVCPAVMAHAIQCNLNAIDALEEVRAKAIAACLKKDPIALLAALQNIV